MKPKHSTFVTVVAWIFIALSAWNTIVSILQNVMIHVIFDRTGMASLVQQAPPDGYPPLAALMVTHAPTLVAGLLLISIATLVSSVGLLRRLNWARLCFIGLMLFGIAWQLASLVFQFELFSGIGEQFAEVAEFGGGPDIGSMVPLVLALSGVFYVAVAVLFGWIAIRLISPAIVAEFKNSSTESTPACD